MTREGDLISRQAVIDACEQSINILEAVDRIMDLPSVKQEPSEDCIKRQAALDAMYELCNTGETLKENPWRDNPHIDAITDTINNLPSVKTQVSCGDAVSRQAVHIELEKWITYGEYKYSNATKYLYDRIDRLPPVNPHPKTGHWIHRTQDGGCFWEECSVCHTERAFSTKYCPDCGTYMYADIRAGEAESEDKE